MMISRRDFLKGLGAGGAVLLIGFRFEALAEGGLFEPNAYIAVDSAGQVKLWIPWQEIGQGSLTAVSMLIADELEADWSRIDMQMAPAETRYGQMSTGGSRSVRESWEPLRRAGAAAREMLISAAAARWGLEADSLRARGGAVEHPASGRRLEYGELVAEAAKLDVPASPALKEPADFRIIGKSIPRVDSPDKIDGKAIYGFDVRRPGMLHAALLAAPFLGGRLADFDDAAARAVPGVREVIALEDEIAVLAEDSWSAFRGRDALVARWDRAEGSSFDSTEFRSLLRDLVGTAGIRARREGDPDGVLAASPRVVEATYELPFLAHASMETMNATADFKPGSLHVEAPTQGPSWCRYIASRAAEMDMEQVSFQPLLAGGGFGRRLFPDYVDAPVRLSKQVGRPVKVIWSREDDFSRDRFRPASAHRMRAALGEDGLPLAWAHTLASPSIGGRLNPASVASGLDEGVLMGAENLPYSIANILVDLHLPKCPLPIGWLRSVYDQQNAFANESFMDELAREGGRDPVDLRLSLLGDSPRLRAVLERVAEASNWGGPTPEGRGRGLSCHHCFGTSVAMVAEVSEGRGGIRVEKITVAVDCGTVVHPDGLRSQVEGGVAFALSGALREEARIEKGEFKSLNFDDYRVLRMDEMPEVEVHTVEVGSEIGGIGEPPVPPTAAAVANAWFALTGRRVRRLPMMPTRR